LRRRRKAPGSYTTNPNNPFNKLLVGRSPGRYSLCATSHGVEGCQHAEVVADPRR